MVHEPSVVGVSYNIRPQDSQKLDIENGGHSVLSGFHGDKQEGLQVQDVTYTVAESPWWEGCCGRTKRIKPILQGVSLCVKRGQLTALLGNSGELYPLTPI